METDPPLFNDLELEILDLLLDGDLSVMNVFDFVHRLEFKREDAIGALVDLYKRNYIEFFERKNILKTEGIANIRPDLNDDDIRGEVMAKNSSAMFGVNLTQLGRDAILSANMP